MALTDLDLKFKYRSDEDALYKSFYEPCLGQSIFYDRAAGYFSSYGLQTIAKGFEYFIANGGRMRVVANPYLSDEDIEAITKGYQTKQEVIENSLLREIELTANTIQNDTLNVISWLISNNQLDFKIAYTKNNALYHEKFGLFRDIESNYVAFSGSSNETAGGLKNNFEKIDVFLPSMDQHRIEDMKEDFDRLWGNKTEGLEVIDIPQSVKQKLLSYKKEFPLKPVNKSSKIEPRAYQKEAINALKNNAWQGILEMATGTGKTITSLLAMSQYREQNGRAFLLIFAPFTHLVDQWADELKKFDIKYVTLCYGAKNSWLGELESEVRNYNLEITDFHVVLTTYKTAAMPHFVEQIGKVQKNAVLIADECHYMGSPTFSKLNFNNIQARIGLSATPDRWWDENGTAYLKNFFKGVVYRYTLDDAIEAGKLTPYSYEPHIVNMTESELEQYKYLTNRIISLYNHDQPDEEKISALNRKRALILAKAEGKIPILVKLLKEKGIASISHTIVYCAERQVNELTLLLSSMGLRVHKFDSTVPNKERQQILKAFDREDIQVLVAIKCLDEGIDIPSTRCAFFLASTSNPREFVQRRGRILRNAPGKIRAEVHDFIVLPQETDEKTFEGIAKKEFPRFAEFCDSSVNKSTVKKEMFDILSPYNLNHFMYMKPWDVYKEMKEEFTNGCIE